MRKIAEVPALIGVVGANVSPRAVGGRTNEVDP
jgi:hypothetical protein